jgi:uncharacterized iron-regulated membrane protein
MDGRFFPFGNSRNRPNPLVQALWLVLGVAVLVGLVLIGTIVFLAVVGLAVSAFLGFKLRAWWLRRRAAAPGRAAGRRACATSKANTKSSTRTPSGGAPASVAS